jgi:DNA-binding LacI/PurR family transcriptional regulator
MGPYKIGMASKRQEGRRPDERAAHRKVAQALARKFVTGVLPQGSLLPSRRTLAREYETSEKVVRLALSFLASEGRILRTAQGMYRVGNQGAVASARANSVVLVLAHNLRTQWDFPEWRDVQEGIERAMGDQWDPLLIVHEPGRILRRRIPPDLLDGSLRGILLMGQFTETALKAYAKLDLPVVLVDRPPSGRGLASVSVDNESAACDAVHRLFEMGHRRVAFARRVHLGLSAIDDDSKEREQGFLRAFRELKLKQARACIHNLFGRERARSTNVQAIFRRRPRYTAVLAVDLEAAEVVAGGAREVGLVVPSDLSVACFQSKTAPKFWSGPRIDFVALGERAVSEGLGRGRPRVVKVPTEWEPGRTVRPPRSKGRAERQPPA